MNEYYPLIIAAVAGSLMAWQGGLNSLLQREVSLMPATLIVHIIGTITAGIIVLFQVFKQTETLNWVRLTSAPWHSYLGGIIGVAIIGAVAFSIAESGAAPATTAIIVSQIITATFIDHLGLFRLEEVSFSVQHLIGILLLAVGTWFLLQN